MFIEVFLVSNRKKNLDTISIYIFLVSSRKKKLDTISSKTKSNPIEMAYFSQHSETGGITIFFYPLKFIKNHITKV